MTTNTIFSASSLHPITYKQQLKQHNHNHTTWKKYSAWHALEWKFNIPLSKMLELLHVHVYTFTVFTRLSQFFSVACYWKLATPSLTFSHGYMYKPCPYNCIHCKNVPLAEMNTWPLTRMMLFTWLYKLFLLDIKYGLSLNTLLDGSSSLSISLFPPPPPKLDHCSHPINFFELNPCFVMGDLTTISCQRCN